MAKPKRKYRTADEWAAIITEWKVSELTPKRFCLKRNLSYSSFCEHKRKSNPPLLKKVKTKTQSPTFFELQRDKNPLLTRTPLFLAQGDLQIHLPEGCSFDFLKDCLKTLKEVVSCSH